MSINHRRISITIASSLLLEIINKISPLLILHHAQKVLGLHDFGWAQIQLAIFETLQPIVTYGYASYALAETSGEGEAQSQDKLGRLFNHILLLKVINALIVTAVYLGNIYFKGGTIDVYAMAVLSVVMLASIFDYYWICILRHKIAKVSLLTGLLRVGSLIAILTLVKSPGEKGLFVGLSLLPNALLSIGTGIYAYRLFAFSRVNLGLLKEMFIKSTPFAILVFMVTLLDRVDIFAVERFFGLALAGAYVGPAKVVQSLSMIISSLSLPFFAEILKVTDSDSLSKHVNLSLWFLSALISPIIFGMPFIEGDVLRILFSEVPANIEQPLSLLAVSMLGTVFISVFGLQLLMSKGKPWPIIKATLVYMLFVPVGIFLAKDVLGLRAAAYSVIVGKWSVGLYCLYAARSYLPRIPWMTFFKPLAAGAGMWLCLKLLNRDELILNIAIGGVAYVICMLITNFKEFKEIAQHPKFKRLFRIKG